MKLAEIRAREQAATKGEWKSDEMYIVAEVPWGRPGGEVIGQMHPTAQGPRPEYSKSERVANASFSAHAKQDIPDLLDALENAIELLGYFSRFAKEIDVGPYMFKVMNQCKAFLAKHGASRE